MVLSTHYLDCPKNANCRCEQRAADHLEMLTRAAQQSTGRLAYIRVAIPVPLTPEHGQPVPGCKGGVRKIILQEGSRLQEQIQKNKKRDKKNKEDDLR